jgi:hypothetical protein
MHWHNMCRPSTSTTAAQIRWILGRPCGSRIGLQAMAASCQKYLLRHTHVKVMLASIAHEVVVLTCSRRVGTGDSSCVWYYGINPFEGRLTGAFRMVWQCSSCISRISSDVPKCTFAGADDAQPCITGCPVAARVLHASKPVSSMLLSSSRQSMYLRYHENVRHLSHAP